MKKIIFIAIAIFLSLGISAQSFGLKGGMSNATLVGGDVTNAGSVTGALFGVFSQRGDDAIRYTAELNFIRKGFSVDMSNYYYDVTTVEYKLNYIDFVFMGNFHVTDEFAINAGPYAGYALSGKVEAGSQSQSIDDWDGYNRVEVGGAVGVSYWINDMLIIDGRYAYGFTKLADDGLTAPEAYNGVIQVSVGYLFTY